LGREVLNPWREFELSLEPGFDRVLIGRRNIEKVGGKQGANMTEITSSTSALPQERSNIPL
jgi:hypothetical protein